MKLHCAICGKLLNHIDSTSINYPNKDHIIPVKKVDKNVGLIFNIFASVVKVKKDTVFLKTENSM